MADRAAVYIECALSEAAEVSGRNGCEQRGGNIGHALSAYHRIPDAVLSHREHVQMTRSRRSLWRGRSAGMRTKRLSDQNTQMTGPDPNRKFDLIAVDAKTSHWM
jgi:hypothetical protein